MTRFKVTYTNLHPRCTLCSSITKVIFADDAKEASQFCDDLYNDCNGDFKIISVESIS